MIRSIVQILLVGMASLMSSNAFAVPRPARSAISPIAAHDGSFISRVPLAADRMIAQEGHTLITSRAARRVYRIIAWEYVMSCWLGSKTLMEPKSVTSRVPYHIETKRSSTFVFDIIEKIGILRCYTSKPRPWHT